MAIYGGIEAGGTKFVCAVGNEHGVILNQAIIRTQSPKQTMPQLIDYFRQQNKSQPIAAIGIGSFGPIDNNPSSPHYGRITTAPKVAWQAFNIVNAIKTEFNLPVGFETDVSAAALGEYCWGEAQGLKDFIYMTVGTGIGAAAMIRGRLLRGIDCPEMGHMLIPHHLEQDPFVGNCSFHHDCLEGLASGVAIKERWQVQSALDLPPDHPAWDLEAEYLAMALTNIMWVLSPQKIIMGGGVMKQIHLFDKIRQHVKQKLGGYAAYIEELGDLSEYIVPPGLANLAGVSGAIEIARRAHTEK